MGEVEVATEVGEAVANGTVSPTKPDKDVSEKKDGKREEVKEMCEDMKENVKDKNEEVNVEKEDTEASKDGKEGERKELKDSKEEGEDKRKEEAKREPMEVDDGENANKLSEDKCRGLADLNEEEDKADAIKEAGPKKSATKKSGGEKGKNKTATEEKNEEPKTPVGPTIDRPIRERKSVERLVAVIEKDTAKEFHIEKGRGTALKDIPNVAHKLSKKKVADDTLKLLHTVLFGRRGKALLVKGNILQFSGFSWHENEEKPKAKVQEKLDKCNKEKLFEFCDLLDVPVARTTAKKEDVIAKLMDFLLVPHATTSKLLAEKEEPSKGNKRKRPSKKNASPSVATPSKGSSKKQKTKSASKEDTGPPELENTEEEENTNENQNVYDGTEKSESKESEPESGEDSKKRKRSSKKPSKKESTPYTKPKKQVTPKKSSPLKETPTEANPSQSKSKDQSVPTTKTFSRKKKNKNNVVNEKPLTPKKSPSKEKTGRKDVKEKEKPKGEKQKPSDDELKTAICEILKEVDFNTATFTDILKLLNTRFNTELTPRKASIKLMIQEELTKLADEEDESEPEKPVKEALAQKA